MSPPYRPREHQEVLWQALQDGDAQHHRHRSLLFHHGPEAPARATSPHTQRLRRDRRPVACALAPRRQQWPDLAGTVRGADIDPRGADLQPLAAQGWLEIGADADVIVLDPARTRRCRPRPSTRTPISRSGKGWRCRAWSCTRSAVALICGPMATFAPNPVGVVIWRASLWPPLSGTALAGRCGIGRRAGIKSWSPEESLPWMPTASCWTSAWLMPMPGRALLVDSPQSGHPLAYWPMDRWQVDKLEGEKLEQLRRCLDEDFWASVPAIPGALSACRQLSEAGYELVCVTAPPGPLCESKAGQFAVTVVPDRGGAHGRIFGRGREPQGANPACPSAAGVRGRLPAVLCWGPAAHSSGADPARTERLRPTPANALCGSSTRGTRICARSPPGGWPDRPSDGRAPAARKALPPVTPAPAGRVQSASICRFFHRGE